jgi:hypothetical protein
MSYGDFVRLLNDLQEKSEVPFNLIYNPKERTIKIDYNVE